MMFDFVWVLILVVLIALFAFLFVRAWGSKRAWLKWLGLLLSGLLTLVLLLVLVLALVGFSKLNAQPNNPVSSLKAQATPDQMARISRYANLCAGCHSTTGQPPLDGSKDNFFASPPFGTMYPPNLTPYGPLKDWTDGEIVRAIREGVHKNGRPLIIMPSEVLHNLSDADVQALVAYLRAQKPVPHDVPENGLNVIGALLVATGAPLQTNQAPITQPVVAPPAGVTADYGSYLVHSLGCTACHGKDLAGGEPGPGGEPPGPNLTVLVPKWSEADFMKTIRTGTDPTGKALNPDAMPWKEYSAAFTDDELKAVYAYLKGLQPIIKPASK